MTCGCDHRRHPTASSPARACGRPRRLRGSVSEMAKLAPYTMESMRGLSGVLRGLTVMGWLAVAAVTACGSTVHGASSSTVPGAASTVPALGTSIPAASAMVPQTGSRAPGMTGPGTTAQGTTPGSVPATSQGGALPTAGNPSGPTVSGTDCFAHPGSCGYPDPAYGNVGILAGTTLTPSGSLVIKTAGKVINAEDVSGTIVIAANNVTIENTRITASGGCGPTTPCGSADIVINEGVSGTLLEHDELTNASNGATIQHAVYNWSSASATADGIYVHSNTTNNGGVDSMWWGPGLIENSYEIAALAISQDHVENVYEFAGAKLDVEHNTFYNPVDTATVFVDAQGGGVADVTVNNNLLAGGGYTLYPAGNGSAGTAVITNNRFARCLSAAIEGSGGTWTCQNGFDAYGYFPRGGAFGLATDLPGGTTWTGNYWDDAPTQTICSDGTKGCP